MGELNSSEIKGHYVPHKGIFAETSPRSPFSTHSPAETDSIDLAIDGAADTSIDQLYSNVCDMQSSDQSPSRLSYLSYGEESRIDSELRFLAEGDYGDVEIKKEIVVVNKKEVENNCSEEDKTSKDKNPGKINRILHAASKAKKASFLKSESEAPKKSSGLKSKSFNGIPRSGKVLKKLDGKIERNSSLSSGVKVPQNGAEDASEAAYLAPYILKQTRDLISSGENLQKALELALRALNLFEASVNEKPNLEYVMCLHVVAALYCRLGKYSDAIPLLEKSIEIPVMDLGQNHSLAKFAGCMQLGDTYAMTGAIENSILFYTAGLEIQRQVLGEKDSRFGETCRYVAEAHVQAMQFDMAEKLCQMALDIHKDNVSPASLEEAADRRLLGLIFDSKGDHESALEHYVLASMAMAGNGQEADVAAVDCNIGDAYLSLARYDEAISAYQKALSVFKSTKGDKHPSVATVYVRLADLHNKIGKFSECRSNCANALRIFNKPIPGCNPEEIASGLVDVSAIYESLGEPDQALKLLQKAIKAYGNAPGQKSTIAGIEAQIGVLFYILGSYSESYDSLKRAILKFRAVGEKKNAIFGMGLNQMGLACLQLYAINEAAELFEEARNILEAECGPYHAETLGVYSNLSGAYDAMGRTGDAIEILEYVVELREERLGTANPDVHDEKRRLEQLLKEAGRVRNRGSRSLEALLDNNTSIATNPEITVS